MPRRFLAITIALAANLTVSAGTKTAAQQPRNIVTTWSRAAQALPYAINPDPALRNARVPSPDGRYEITCAVVPKENKVTDAVTETLEAPACELVAPSKRTVIDLQVGPEALWAPDSDAVAITHSHGGALGTYHVVIYRPENGSSTEIATAVRNDLARRFPACVGSGCTAEERRRLRRNSDWVNVAAIRWIERSNRLLMMAWVPDSSSFGANLGRYNGYEVETRTGRILRRYDQREFKQRFGKYCGDWGL